MADFQFFAARYFVLNPTTNAYDYDVFSGLSNNTGTITDGDGLDTIFQENEVLDGDPDQGLGRFVGTQTNSDGTKTVWIRYDGAALVGGDLYVAYSGSPTLISGDPTPTSAVVAGDFVVCFAAGTLIATPDGERAVETLANGDPVLTADGQTVPVKWVGRTTVHKTFTPAERFAPVRVRAGALGDGLPHTDLVLTADHALILDGLAIHSSALVNGTTITREPVAALPDRVTYYHVETEAHDVILANGAPAETFIDNVARRAFDNVAEFEALHGATAQIPEMDLPRVVSARQLPAAIRARLGLAAAA